MFMWTTKVNSLSQVADHPMSSPCWVDRAGPRTCPHVSYHAFERLKKKKFLQKVEKRQL